MTKNEKTAYLVERYAIKFAMDRSRNTPVTDEILQSVYKNCALPANKNLYPSIKAKINELKLNPEFHFCGEIK